MCRAKQRIDKEMWATNFVPQKKSAVSESVGFNFTHLNNKLS